MQFLFTHPSEPAALALGRLLAAEGHSICAAEDERTWGTAPARYSRSYTRFHRLSPATNLIELWRRIGRKLDAVILFGSLSPHIRQHLEYEGAKIIGADLFANDHDFQRFLRNSVIPTLSSASCAVKVPAVFQVHSLPCIAEILSHYPTTTFSLQPDPYYVDVGGDDDEDDESDDEDDRTLVDVEPPHTVAIPTAHDNPNRVIVSCTKLNDELVETIKTHPISEARPYQLEETIEGGTLHYAHALVIDDQIRSFMVTMGPEECSEFVVVASSQLLFAVLHQFTRKFVDALVQQRYENQTENRFFAKESLLSTHVSIGFRVKEEIRPSGLVRAIVATSCSTKPHSSLRLLCAVPSLRHRLARAYTGTVGFEDTIILPTTRIPLGVYSLHCLLLIIFKILSSFKLRSSDSWCRLARWIMLSLVWFSCFEEEVWSWVDPGPALCLWVVMGLQSLAQRQGLA